MTLPTIVSRNQIQGIPSTALNVRKVNESPAEFYTCPTGKKALISGSCSCDGTGAGTEIRLIAGGVVALRFDSGDVNDLTTKLFNISLEAGQTLAKGQNSGTNGQLDLNCSVLETPA